MLTSGVCVQVSEPKKEMLDLLDFFATAPQTSESDTTSTSSPMQSMKSYAIPKLQRRKGNLITRLLQMATSLTRQ